MWDDARRMNALTTGLLVLAAGLLAWGGLAWLVRQPAFAIREVALHAPPERASAAYLEAVVRDELSGTFFTMNLDRTRSALARVPWVHRVALRRQWPGRLEVEIEEYVPLARWNDASLLSTQGEIFVADYNGELPLFTGPDARAGEIAARYREWGAALAPLGLAIGELDLSPRGGWRLTASGGAGPMAIEIGRDEPAARLARFVAAYARTIAVLAHNGTAIDHVDLRYRNGFAARVPGFKEHPRKKAT